MTALFTHLKRVAIKKPSLLLLLVVAVQFSVEAQNKILVSGSVVDATTNDPLSFATVSLKKQLIGIVTNEVGRFDLYVSEEMMNDSLMFSNFGYKPQAVALKNVHATLNIRLQQSSVDLKEVVIKPQPPEFYLKLAILRIKNNYANMPFQSEAYYREKVLENKNFIKCNEGVFKTYYPNYLDTVKNQNQLLLFREEKDIHELAFMKKEREEAEAKEKKRVAKQEAKNKKKGKTEPVKAQEPNGVAIDLASSFGGPNEILRQGDITKHPDGFLDTNEFKEYKYTFAKSSTYNNSELMVIDFKSKGKVDHMRQEGSIYIDVASYAIVKVVRSGSIVIPVIIRPVLFLYGIGIENPIFTSVVEFQQVKSKWFPKNLQYNVNLNMTNKHWFSPNEHSDFVIEAVYTVNKMKIENSAPIPLAKRYDPNKDMKTQVHNDDGITWDGINIIKK
ncbi:carboxypeptidase-like regulatory domain-containing protein [Aurantibacillus circumpalustris]|uniref:carboxypeptidase-like regulatory domain-containing protein n=1 Tax=Aurantibacillus circumpalustris TaxID=3036359 RepID=UPI00295AB4A9|nr:carboxypeptidase-like regulatory domain-containing protein [Aurantibacillus circumpalustris]